MSIWFSELRSPQVAEAARQNAVPVLPLGQIEEHGPHLPLCTDVLLARRVCEEAVKRLEGSPASYVLDPVCYTYSPAVMRRWPGTFIVPYQTVTEVVTHVLCSLADMGFRKMVIAGMHGPLDGLARVVARTVADRCGVGPGVVFPYALVSDVLKENSKAGPGGSCHGGEFETSVMLHLAPELVDFSAAPSGDELRELPPYSSGQAFVSTWTRHRSNSGVYGDPTVATAELGKLLFEKMVAETADFIRYYRALDQV